MLKPGDAAPSTSFTTADRPPQEINLSSFKGQKNVVVAFYPRAFTGGCEREMRFFQTMLPEFQKLDTQIIGSSTDAAPPQKAFADHCGLQFPLWSDFPKYATTKAFGTFNEERVTNSRVTFVIDKQGVIRHVIEDSQDMERHAKESLEVIKKFSQ